MIWGYQMIILIFLFSIFVNAILRTSMIFKIPTNVHICNNNDILKRYCDRLSRTRFPPARVVRGI